MHKHPGYNVHQGPNSEQKVTLMEGEEGFLFEKNQAMSGIAGVPKGSS